MVSIAGFFSEAEVDVFDAEKQNESVDVDTDEAFLYAKNELDQ